MSTPVNDHCPSRERLSSLLDGETDGAAAATACAAWCDEADARRDWHAWHLIGDVLRSDELASSADHDARFLANLRNRLRIEPAPTGATVVALDSVREGRRPVRWMLPSAMAAGLVLVVGTFALVRPDRPVADPESMAQAGAPAAVVAAATTTPTNERAAVGGELRLVTNQQVLRDAQLEQYLAAHKQFAGSTALGVPSAFLRRATVESASR